MIADSGYRGVAQAQDQDNIGPESGCTKCLKSTSCCLSLFAVTLVVTIAVIYAIVFGGFHFLTTGTKVPTSQQPFVEDQCMDRDEDCSAPKEGHSCSADLFEHCRRTCSGCIPFDEHIFHLKAVKADEVEHHMAYVKTGSETPANLQGIWWMDQFGFGVKELIPATSNYTFNFQGTDEVLASFGDHETQWQNDTRCVTPVSWFGGTQGHWAGFDNGNTTNKAWETLYKMHQSMSFCYSNSEETEIDIWIRIKPTGPLKAVLQLPFMHQVGFTDAGQGYYWLPHGMMHLRMVKHPWGWDRISNAFHGWTREVSDEELQRKIRALPTAIQDAIKDLFTMAQTTLHYPVFQIVDGNGKRTKAYQTYLDFINNKSAATEGFNEKPGTLLIPVMSDSAVVE
eukprot:TRINITY_DN64022_c0_g1_i1.p1 TRINITY_DN64022_c0_g1~~TRINITY_DN64022_c0_g1_i1.p1  ORF type:complete len:396 (-),score=64.96 TRINITY_DN64022_c0_g1_i1:151-1338(-)